MDFQSWMKLLEVAIALVQAIIWPFMIIFILIYLGTPLKKFMGSIGEFTFKAGAAGFEASAKRAQIEAAAALGAATVSNKKAVANGEAPPVQEIATIVSNAVTPQAARRLSEASVLWVDDNPSNIVNERRSLQALGIRVALSKSTEDALEQTRLHHYNALISDMGRPPDSRAGYTLLEELRKRKALVPLIFYAVGASRPENKALALTKGAYGSTSHPQELFQLVINAIQDG